MQGGIPLPPESRTISVLDGDSFLFDWLTLDQATDFFYHMTRARLHGTISAPNSTIYYSERRNDRQYVPGASFTDPANPPPTPTVLGTYGMGTEALLAGAGTEVASWSVTQSNPSVAVSVDLIAGEGLQGLHRIAGYPSVWHPTAGVSGSSEVILNGTGGVIGYWSPTPNWYLQRRWRRSPSTPRGYRPTLHLDAWGAFDNAATKSYRAWRFYEITGWEMVASPYTIPTIYSWSPIYTAGNRGSWVLFSESSPSLWSLHSLESTGHPTSLTVTWSGSVPWSHTMSFAGILEAGGDYTPVGTGLCLDFS